MLAVVVRGSGLIRRRRTARRAAARRAITVLSLLVALGLLAVPSSVPAAGASDLVATGAGSSVVLATPPTGAARAGGEPGSTGTSSPQPGPSWLPVRPHEDPVARADGPARLTLERASGTLAEGAGPARGTPLACTTTGPSAAECGRAAGPATSLAEEWQNASVWDGRAGQPAAGSAGSMAYDAYDGYVVYFGGGTDAAWRAETWRFSGGLWYDATSDLSTSPPAEIGSAMDYDEQYQVVLLYGGCSRSACPNNDTWYYTGGTGWTNLTSSLSPSSPPLGGASMAFAADAADGYSVLFGGCRDAVCADLSATTYGFDGFGWLAIPVVDSPPGTWGASLAYDPALGQLVLFGGCDGRTCARDATWTYYNFDWTNRTAAVAALGSTPPGRSQAVLTWDELDATLVLFGGVDDALVLGDTWSLDCPSSGCVWTNRTPTGAVVPTLFGAAAPSVSNASIGTMFFGGEFGRTRAYSPGGAHLFSNGTYFFDPPVAVTETVPAGAAARSAVDVVAHPSGGSGSYPRFAGAYEATWRYNTSYYVGVNATLSFLEPGTYTVLVTAYDAFGVAGTDQFAYTATGPTSSIAGGSATHVGDPVIFSATPATGGNAPYTYLWGFGDGATNTGLTVSHAWGAPGDYPVRLYLTDALGVTATDSRTESVYPAPFVAVNASRTTIDAGQSVSFTSLVPASPLALAYAWEFGDGAAPSTVASPDHVFASSGVFDVTVNVSDPAGGYAEAEVAITVNPALGGSTAPSAPMATAGVAEAFSASGTGGTPPYFFAWDFGDGATAVGPATSHTYGSAGRYSVTVAISDSVGGNLSLTFAVQVAGTTGRPDLIPGTPTTTLAFVAAGAVLAVAVVAVLTLRRRRRDRAARPAAPADDAPKR